MTYSDDTLDTALRYHWCLLWGFVIRAEVKHVQSFHRLYCLVLDKLTRVNSIHTDLMPRNAHTSQDSNSGSNCANVCYTLFYAKLGRELLFLSKKPAFEIVNTRMISMTLCCSGRWIACFPCIYHYVTNSNGILFRELSGRARQRLGTSGLFVTCCAIK